MVSAGDFRNGVTFEEDGNVLQVVEFQHVKPGKGAAFVRTKVKNVITGSVVEKSYNPTAKFPTAYIERKEMVYSYNDDGLYYFMDQETFDMVPVNGSDLSDNFKFVKENDICRILSYKGKVFGVEPPTFVVLEVTKTEPGIKGNTATNTLKPATVETGAEIRVPLFINDNVDVAIACVAEGVHVGQEDMAAAKVREKVGNKMMIGVSVHSVEEAKQAVRDGADCLGVGAMFSTSTKTDVDVLPKETLKAICDAVDIPVVAIGGLNKSNILELSGTGVDGVALVSAIFSAEDIESECRELRALSEKMVNA